MTLPPVIRVFFAIDLQETQKQKIGEFITTLKKKSRTHGIRWSKPENLHITLQFLAKTHTEDLQKLISNVRSRVEGIVKRSQFSFGKLHLFPNPYRPRVIVLDVAPQADLAALSQLIGEGVKISAYEVENRPFRAHLTLGRIKQPQGMNLSFLSTCEIPQFDEITVSEVVLFRSEPQPEGSKYTIIDKMSLTA